MIKNIIFDWSGVICDNLLPTYKTAMLIFKEFGAPEITLEEFRDTWVQPYMLFYNKYMSDLTHEEEVAAFKPAFAQAVAEYSAGAYPGVKETLERFKQMGIKMMVLSSDPRGSILSQVEKFNLGGLFDEIVGEAHDKGHFIHDILARNQFDQKETVFIGDTPHEVEAGKKANVKTISVTWGYKSEKALQTAGPDFIVHNLPELESVILD
ncbi:MAG: HAD family hydrolase [Candidatus Pacebacteria bacterium]|nr:HAD family hydrolase [Candidatus Paceibacterota bacterium]